MPYRLSYTKRYFSELTKIVLKKHNSGELEVSPRFNDVYKATVRKLRDEPAELSNFSSFDESGSVLTVVSDCLLFYKIDEVKGSVVLQAITDDPEIKEYLLSVRQV